MDANRVLWIVETAAPSPSDSAPPSAWDVRYCTPEGALREPIAGDRQAIVLEFPLAGWTVPALWEEVQRLAPGVPVLIRDPQSTLQDAVRMARLGVYQFLTEDQDAFRLIEQAIESRRSANLARLAVQICREEWGELLLGDSREMRQVKHIIRMVGNRRATVLITGETGTGKEVAALAIHRAASRRKGLMVAVNCSALPENLLEAELFGHVRGAFTGAVQNRTGRFEQAQGGTLFLDEIGELPLDLQVKLLRVLQEREYQRLGSSETVKADIRVIAATNCDLTRKIEHGTFREDLYYRLNVVPIQMPPLRQRPEDIPALAYHFVEKICALEEMERKILPSEVVERLCGYSWPGNVRQLENAVEMAIALSGERRALMLPDFPLPAPARARMAVPEASPVISVPDDGLDYERTLAVIERSILDQALRKTNGNKKAAAEMLRLKRTTLSAKVRSLDSLPACN
ncbi:MAG: sigma-54 dependent transcriptional regulator [Candidatus Sulfopaludibacter sp.]|nr:sigma-54 dependent transcriptional regulator [Candidatus Sulfopaludibacter sp.]